MSDGSNWSESVPTVFEFEKQPLGWLQHFSSNASTVSVESAQVEHQPTFHIIKDEELPRLKNENQEKFENDLIWDFYLHSK